MGYLRDPQQGSMVSKAVRIIGATILSSITLALIWSLPAIGNPTWFLMLWLSNSAIAVGLLVVCGTLSHLILRWKRWTKLRQYLGVMFPIATSVLLAIQMSLLEWIFGTGGSEYYLHTQVIARGHLTFGGFVLTLVEACIGGAFLTGSFALFWVIAVRPQSQPSP